MSDATPVLAVATGEDLAALSALVETAAGLTSGRIYLYIVGA